MKIIRKVGDIRHGWRGLRAVWREEWHFKYQAAVALLGFLFCYLLDADAYEMVLLFSTLCLALASEVINTAVEDIGDRINPGFDEKIGAIKDMAQAFVIVASLPAVVVFLWIVLPRLA